MLSRSAAGRLGERLRQGTKDPSDFAELVVYCQQVKLATAQVLPIVRSATVATAVDRSGKSFLSIVEKLRRQSIRLPQIQDIEGCRVIVDSRSEQDALSLRLQALLADPQVDDRRANPTHGYRAVHIVPRIGGERYEIQIRTKLQHVWAQLVELWAEKVDRDLKYGGGPESLAKSLFVLSEHINQLESCEVILFNAYTGQDIDDADFTALHDSLVPGDDSETIASWFERLEEPGIVPRISSLVLKLKDDVLRQFDEIDRAGR